MIQILLEITGGKRRKKLRQHQQKQRGQCDIPSHRCFGLCLLGFLQASFADVKIQPPVFQQSPLFLQTTGGTQSENWNLLQGTNLAAQLAQQGNEQRENILIEKQHKNSYTTYLYSLGWFKYKHNVLKHPGLIVVSSQSYWYSPPVSFQEVTQRSEESGGWGVEELTLSWSQSLLILSHCDQGTP